MTEQRLKTLLIRALTSICDCGGEDILHVGYALGMSDEEYEEVKAEVVKLLNSYWKYKDPSIKSALDVNSQNRPTKEEVDLMKKHAEDLEKLANNGKDLQAKLEAMKELDYLRDSIDLFTTKTPF